jgi:hypothetical protein
VSEPATPEATAELAAHAARNAAEPLEGVVDVGACEAALDLLHPAVRSWFDERFPQGPTAPQAAGWPLIAAGEDTLIAAPTGSGKTLSAFLICIDRFYRAASEGAGTAPVISESLPLFTGASECGAEASAPDEAGVEVGCAAVTPPPPHAPRCCASRPRSWSPRPSRSS